MLLKPRKNKSFNYTPRFSKDGETKTKLEESLKVRDLSSKWRLHQGLGSRKSKNGKSLLVLFLVLILVVICLYYWLDIKYR
tara:strand:- start:10596 stop:10838 length:243 start_codon:yes stop_codon:yes gene_type:complete